MQLFGFQIGRIKQSQEDVVNKTFALPQNDDGAVTIQSGAYYGTYVDLDGVVRNEIELITRYREMAMQPELETAIDDIVNEAIVNDDNGQSVEINTDDLKQPESIKKKIRDEFDNILRILNFGNVGHDLFRRWYIDGRIFYHVVIDDMRPRLGIKELLYIDPRRIRKIREIQKSKDPATGIDIIKKQNEYYLYNERGMIGTHSNLGAKIAIDSVVNVNSGLMDSKRSMVLSYLHKAIKPLNQLRMVEDATVIYRLSRAPERRIFYVDVGNMPTIKAEQYLKDIMTKYRNKLVYDSTTGEIKDDRKHLSMLEDFWLPRREGCFSLDTKIKLLDGRDVELGQLIVEHKLGKKNWTYSVSPEGKIVPGKISWAGVTRTDAEVVDVHLDNGEIITATPDHKFILRNGEKIEARLLVEGSSLMPFYTRDKHLTHNHNGLYPQLMHNDNEKWEFIHRTVSDYFIGPKNKNEVVHHVDMTRRNNNPENLKVMDKLEHFMLHSRMGTNSWKNGDIAEHKRKLSISGKNFFMSDAGLERREEITSFNKTSKEIWNALAAGRKTIKENRARDKEHLSDEDYLSKWSPGLSQEAALKGAQARKDQVTQDRLTLSKADFSAKYAIHNSWKNGRYESRVKDISLQTLIDIIVANANDGNREIIKKIKEMYPEMTLRRVRLFIQKQGYNSISDLIVRNSLSAPKRYIAGAAVNHKVVKIVHRTDRIDVGTLTIDEHHEHHDYHNFALASGIFVMNSKGTEITTLPGGQNLGQMDDVQYFEKKLYKSLGVPISRLESSQGFSLGRATEITRDELKFSKFVQRLRNKFATLFDDLLRVQLILKKVCTEEEWAEFKESIWYDFKKDNNFTELKEAELMTNRITLLQFVDPYVGRYYSEEWVRKNILRQTDEDIEEIDEQIKSEQSAAGPSSTDAMGNPIDPTTGQPIAGTPATGGPPMLPPPAAPPAKANSQQQVQEELPPPPSKFEIQPNELEFTR